MDPGPNKKLPQPISGSEVLLCGMMLSLEAPTSTSRHETPVAMRNCKDTMVKLLLYFGVNDDRGDAWTLTGVKKVTDQYAVP